MNQNRKKSRFPLIDVAAAVLPALLAGVYLLAAAMHTRAGFPLDDAWIHQTFARNFASSGVWSYQVGSSAGGSTSPFWTLLLVPGYWVENLQPYIWTFILGIASFMAVVIFGKKCIELTSGGQKSLSWLWIFLASTSWQLGWAAGSGMETILYCAVIMLVFYLSLAERSGWVWKAGVLTGLGVWIRPDSLTLFGPVLLILLLRKTQAGAKLKSIGIYLASALIPVLGYLVWNLVTSGEIFPNTFYAKQAEYAVLLNAPLLSRLINVFRPIFVGVNILLLPGMLYSMVKSLKDHSYKMALIFIWCVGYGLVYALRLPVSYQHGRYLMPVLAPLMLLGTIGTFELIRYLSRKRNRVSWVVSRVWLVSIVLVGAAFWFNGIHTYTEDVKGINRLMVSSAKWIEANSDAADVIAVHDIGAMGYFSDRSLIDLAGLINPDVIPFIRDENKLEGYIQMHHATYLVVLKDWYPELEKLGTPVAQFDYTQGSTDEEMLVRKIGE